MWLNYLQRDVQNLYIIKCIIIIRWMCASLWAGWVSEWGEPGSLDTSRSRSRSTSTLSPVHFEFQILIYSCLSAVLSCLSLSSLEGICPRLTHVCFYFEPNSGVSLCLKPRSNSPQTSVLLLNDIFVALLVYPDGVPPSCFYFHLPTFTYLMEVFYVEYSTFQGPPLSPKKPFLPYEPCMWMYGIQISQKP